MKKVASNSRLETKKIPFPVVGIGASAGGLDAFKRFLKAIPRDSGMAYIFIQHMNAEHESLLPEILTKLTSIPVHPIQDEILLLPDHVYVMPSSKLLTVVDGILKLQDRDPCNKNIKTIDLFFSSLGIVHQSFAVGVVLSGTATDGTLGLKVIKANGGLTFAQDNSAAFDGMPHNAIKSGDVDFVLPPEEIPQKLVSINQPFKTIQIKKDGDELATEDEESVLKQILALLRSRKMVDFSQYKKTTIKRRVIRRMALNKLTESNDYLNLLRHNKQEQEILYNDLLICVTQFFRDTKTFDVLRNKILPALFEENKNTSLRIWVAGCATGQEAYSLAIVIHEYFKDHPKPVKVQLFATDISEPSIVKARQGIYDKSEMEGLSNEQIGAYFNKWDGKFQVAKQIREICVFATHNMLQDPPFAHMDIISCRNVLIYLEQPLQKKILSTFHYALNDKGYLMLGKSESPGSSSPTVLYNVFDLGAKIYLKKGSGRSNLTLFHRHSPQADTISLDPPARPDRPDFQKKADELILSRFSPPGVVVNEEAEIVQFRGATGRWLEPSPGKASLSLLKMIKPALSFELRNLMHKARLGSHSVKKENLHFLTETGEDTVTLEVMLLPGEDLHYLILFQAGTAKPIEHQTAADPSTGTSNRAGELRISQLEMELFMVREDMRRITEDQETVNEELQSANEELSSGSEELQTLNEELQTSYEEVQSTNEELQTVNRELLERNEQLYAVSRYIEMVIDTIRDPLLVLDKDLRVKTASKGFHYKFNTNEGNTIGLSLQELAGGQFDDPELIQRIKAVSSQHPSFHDFEIECPFPVMGKRLMLINGRQLDTVSEKLVLISMEEIAIDRMERLVIERTQSLQTANTQLESTNQNLSEFAYVASHDLQEPLRKIQVFTNRLNEKLAGHITDEEQEYVNKILDSSERMSRLIEDLLKLARQENNAADLKMIDLNIILKQIRSDFDLAITQKKAELDIGNLDTIEATRLGMSQLFYNLMANALKFVQPDIKPVIKIHSGKLTSEEKKNHPVLDPDRDYCKIEFSDNGIGFSQANAEKVFTIFQRLNNRRKYEGTGIGLAICRKIVQNLQGLIFAQSKEMEGTTFVVILPYRQLDAV